jgi:hypothetical protein
MEHIQNEAIAEFIGNSEMAAMIAAFVKPELLVVVVICFLAGLAIKHSHTIDTKWILPINLVLGVGLSCLWVFSMYSHKVDDQNLLMAIFIVITQGFLCAMIPTYVHQFFHKFTEKKHHASEQPTVDLSPIIDQIAVLREAQQPVIDLSPVNELIALLAQEKTQSSIEYVVPVAPVFDDEQGGTKNDPDLLEQYRLQIEEMAKQLAASKEVIDKLQEMRSGNEN